MSKTLFAVLASMSVALGAGITTEAVAGQAKKKMSAKPAMKVAANKPKPMARTVSFEDSATNARLVQSSAALVQDPVTGSVLFEKNASMVVPIASITKLMTAMVVLDTVPALNEVLTVTEEDVDTLKGTRSRLVVGTRLTREEMLHLALMSSENRAASALSRHYPGGREAFIAAMNQKARDLGLDDTQFADPTGLTAANVSSARDLAKMVTAAYNYPLIREFSTSAERQVMVGKRMQSFHNTNSLVKSPSWEIGLQKTGYISEAGKCLVMHTWLNNKPTVIVLLDSWGKMTRIGDANRIKRWVESASVGGRTTGRSA